MLKTSFFSLSCCFFMTVSIIKFLLYVCISSFLLRFSLEFLSARYCFFFYWRVSDLKFLCFQGNVKKKYLEHSNLYSTSTKIVLMENPKLKKIVLCAVETQTAKIRFTCVLLLRPVFAELCLIKCFCVKIREWVKCPE